MEWTEGIYGAAIEMVRAGKSSAKGTPCIEITIRPYAKQNGETWTKFANEDERFNLYVWLTDKAMDQAIQRLESLGFNGDFANPELTETKMSVKCKHETYNGKTQIRWEFPGGGIDKLDASAIRNLNAKFRAKRGKPAAAEAPLDVDGGTGDDIPF